MPGIMMSIQKRAPTVRRTYQLHDRTNGALHADPVITVDGDETGRATQSRELNEGAIVAHDCLQILSAVGDHPIQLARKDGSIARDDRLGLGERRSPEKHVIFPPTFVAATWRSMSRALCTPKNSPVIQITLLFLSALEGLAGLRRSGPTRPWRGDGR